MSSNRRTSVVVASVLVVVLAVVLIVVSRRSGSSSDPSGAAASSPTTLPTGALGSTPGGPGAGTVPNGTAGGPSDTVADPTAANSETTFPSVVPPANLPPEAPVPLQVSVSPTSGLTNGAPVTIRVTADPGSQFFGLEGYVCKAGATVRTDAQMRPTKAGQCVSKAMNDGSDHYVFAAVPPPYQSAEFTVRAPVGTDTYTMENGTPVTITCGPGNPCVLVLKLQYPNGYGFRTYPLNYG